MAALRRNPAIRICDVARRGKLGGLFTCKRLHANLAPQYFEW
jgi:hypothetical protein